MNKILIFFLFINLSKASSQGLLFFEPNIECTIIKVHKTIKTLGLESFPKLFDTIYNNSIDSTLYISKKMFKEFKPKTILKNKHYEEIEIIFEDRILTLQIWGKPISRIGFLKEGSVLIGEMTCH